MNETLLRHWLLLRHLPVSPKKVDAATLERACHERGMSVTRRSVQRDLIDLSRAFPVVCDDRTKPFGWSWARDADPLEVPAMDPQTALAFRLVGDYLVRLLPRTTFAALTPHVRRAEQVLGALPENLLAGWPEKVRVLPRGVPVTPPDVRSEVLNAVYRGLLEDRCLRVTYTRRGANQSKTYEVHPLGLVFRDAIVYLVVWREGEEGPVQLVLHRMQAAEVLETPRRTPDAFDLDAYIRSGAFGMLLGDAPLALRVKFRRVVTHRLAEAPVGKDQRLVDLPDDDVMLEVTLPDTIELRTWLLGFGDLAEVVSPPELRDELREVTALMAACYAE